MKIIPYASAIGSIMYAMLCTRPDVCLVISLAGRYQSNPGVDHWTAVKNILKYLKRTKDMFLVYAGDKELVVNGYIDASFDTDPDDSKLVQVQAKRHGWIYMQAEYIAASEAANEGVWMKEFI